MSITDTGFTDDHPAPSDGNVVIQRTETVSWSYDNVLADHGVSFADDPGGGASCPAANAVTATPPCPIQFNTPGQFPYYDPKTCTTGYNDPACTDAWRGIVRVDAPAAPSFTVSPNPGRRDQAFSFSGTANEPGMPESASTFSWDFGDGTNGTGKTVSHTYAAAGTYQVTLTVTDDLGNTATATQTVSVYEPDDDADGVGNIADECPDVPGTQPNGCPAPVVEPPPTPLPVVPPAITVGQTAADTLSVEGLLRDGLVAVFECSGKCSALATLLPVSGVRLAQAKPLATRTGALEQAGTLRVALKLTAAGKAALRKVKRSARLKLTGAVTDAAGRVKATSTAITVRRVPAAKRLPKIGISDQQATTFTDPLFTVLNVRYARYVPSWDAIFRDPGGLDAWMQAARAARVKPLIAFNHSRGDLCPKKPCYTPSVREYTRAFKAFRRKYPWVTDFTPWNEANHSTQPTGRKPKLAAQYYNAARRACKRCRITAAAVLDQNNMRSWITEFKRYARGKPRLWGLHNYRDTNRFRDSGTTRLLKLVEGEIWLAETGGIVRFETAAGKVALPRSESRAKRAMTYMFKLAMKHSKRIKRVYIYQWRVNATGQRFDAGVVTPEGKPRPSYDVVSLYASAARR